MHAVPPSPLDRYQGALLGLAAGDALGTTVEFKPRGTFRPIADMVGGGPFGLKPGEWTDDTSMALCLAESLLERGFDPTDHRLRRPHPRGRGCFAEVVFAITDRSQENGNTIADAGLPAPIALM